MQCCALKCAEIGPVPHLRVMTLQPLCLTIVENLCTIVDTSGLSRHVERAEEAQSTGTFICEMASFCCQINRFNFQFHITDGRKDSTIGIILSSVFTTPVAVIQKLFQAGVSIFTDERATISDHLVTDMITMLSKKLAVYTFCMILSFLKGGFLGQTFDIRLKKHHFS